MKYIERAIQAVLFLTALAVFTSIGYMAAASTIEPEIIDRVETITETVVEERVVSEEVPVEREYTDKLILGVYADMHVEKDPSRDDEGLMYIITVRYDRSKTWTEATVWLPWADGAAGVKVMVPAHDCAISVEAIGDATALPTPSQPEPGSDKDSDDF